MLSTGLMFFSFWLGTLGFEISPEFSFVIFFQKGLSNSNLFFFYMRKSNMFKDRNSWRYIWHNYTNNKRIYRRWTLPHSNDILDFLWFLYFQTDTLRQFCYNQCQYRSRWYPCLYIFNQKGTKVDSQLQIHIKSIFP